MTFFTKVFRFGVVGVATAFIHYGLLYAGVEGLQLNVTLASSLGFVVAVIFNYLMHYSWTFTDPAPHGRTLRRYLLMITFGFFINALVMYVGADYLAMHYLLTQALALIVVIVWNFLLSNFWVFRA